MIKKLTLQEIDAARTPKGGWTRKQLAEWGVPWPAPKGWRKALTVGSYDKADPEYDFRGDMTVVELHDLLRKVVLAVVENFHSSDLHQYPEVLAYFGAQLPDDPDTAYGPSTRSLFDGDRLEPSAKD